MTDGGHIVAIVESSKNEAASQSLNGDKKRGDKTYNTSSPTLKLVKNKTIPPRREAPGAVRTTECSTFMSEPSPYKTDESRTQVAIAIAEILPNEPLCMMLFNTLKGSVTLPKIVKVGQSTEAPSTTASISKARQCNANL